MTKIIGLCGNLGSGKDTAAEILSRQHGFKHLAMAWHIKCFAQDVFLFSSEQLWGPSDNRNAVDPRYTKDSKSWEDAEYRLLRFGPKFCAKHISFQTPHPPYHLLRDWFTTLRAQFSDCLSPRIVLQTLGTDWGRALDPDIWLKATVNEALSFDKVVISDIRFLNEMQFIQSHGGKIIKIYRPNSDGLANSIGLQAHESETAQQAIPDSAFDSIILNDKSLTEFESKVKTTVGVLFL